MNWLNEDQFSNDDKNIGLAALKKKKIENYLEIFFNELIRVVSLWLFDWSLIYNRTDCLMRPLYWNMKLVLVMDQWLVDRTVEIDVRRYSKMFFQSYSLKVHFV